MINSTKIDPIQQKTNYPILKSWTNQSYNNVILFTDKNIGICVEYNFKGGWNNYVNFQEGECILHNEPIILSENLYSNEDQSIIYLKCNNKEDWYIVVYSDDKTLIGYIWTVRNDIPFKGSVTLQNIDNTIRSEKIVATYNFGNQTIKFDSNENPHNEIIDILTGLKKDLNSLKNEITQNIVKPKSWSDNYNNFPVYPKDENVNLFDNPEVEKYLGKDLNNVPPAEIIQIIINSTKKGNADKGLKYSKDKTTPSNDKVYYRLLGYDEKIKAGDIGKYKGCSDNIQFDNFDGTINDFNDKTIYTLLQHVKREINLEDYDILDIDLNNGDIFKGYSYKLVKTDYAMFSDSDIVKRLVDTGDITNIKCILRLKKYKVLGDKQILEEGDDIVLKDEYREYVSNGNDICKVADRDVLDEFESMKRNGFVLVSRLKTLYWQVKEVRRKIK